MFSCLIVLRWLCSFNSVVLDLVLFIVVLIGGIDILVGLRLVLGAC